MLSPKRAKLASKDNVPLETEYLKSLQAIEILQDQMDSLQSKHDREIAKLEIKLEAEKKPVYMKREEAIGRIPNFWVTALMNHPDLAELIHESEEEYLLYLSTIEVEFTGDSTNSFKLIFHFNENPYFKNTTLVKDYIMTDTGSDEKPPFRSINATPVQWKDGQDISETLRKRRSFLLWLTTLEFGTTDYDIAQIIKEDLWGNPLPYFLLSDNENDENSEDGDEDEDDILIIEDSNEGKSTQEEPEEGSENDTEEVDSTASSEVTHPLFS